VSSLRSLDRFWVFPLMCLAIAAGAGAKALLRGIDGVPRAALVTLLAVLIVGELLVRPPVARVDHLAQSTLTNDVLRHLPAGPVLELPEPLGPFFAYVNAAREYNSLIDLDPRVDGYSGNIPAATSGVEALASASSVASLVAPMRGYGVRYLVLHREPQPCVAGYDRTELASIVRALRRTRGVASILSPGGDVIVILSPAPITRHIASVMPYQRPIDCGLARVTPAVSATPR
jgi:hypothetical protein